MKLIHRPLGLIRENLSTYITLNVLIYGTLAASLLFGALFPALAESGLNAMSAFASASPIGPDALSAGADGDMLALAGLILFSTVVFGGIMMALLPSLLIPFSGVVIHMVFAALLGLSYAPVDGWRILGAHSLTLLLELQGYILLLLGTTLLARYTLTPGRFSLPTRRAGYLRGLSEICWMCVPAALVLILGALYESFEFVVILA